MQGALISDLVKRIREVAPPLKIILFGSAARGPMGPNSDLDLLIIKRGTYDKLRAMSDIRQRQ